MRLTRASPECARLFLLAEPPCRKAARKTGAPNGAQLRARMLTVARPVRPGACSRAPISKLRSTAREIRILYGKRMPTAAADTPYAQGSAQSLIDDTSWKVELLVGFKSVPGNEWVLITVLVPAFHHLQCIICVVKCMHQQLKP